MKIKVRHIILAALVVAFGYAIYRYRDQLQQIWALFLQAQWEYMFVALIGLAATVLVQGIWYANVYGLLNLPERIFDMARVYLVRRFVTVAAPSGGFSGWIPFLDYANQRNLALGKVFGANVVYTIIWFSVLSLVLLVGNIILIARDGLIWYIPAASAAVLAIDLLLIGALVLSTNNPDRLTAILKRLGRYGDKLLGEIEALNQPPSEYLMDVRDGLVKTPEAIEPSEEQRQLLTPVMMAVINDALHMGILYCVGLAFNLNIPVAGLVTLYGLSMVFFIISPTPGGIGFVEGVMITAASAFGLSGSEATAVTLTYRGVTFWLPFILGFTMTHFLNADVDDSEAEEQPA